LASPSFKDEASIWKQVVSVFLGGFRQVSQPQGWSSSAKEEDLMFDNEIDWVTRLEALLLL
jgi:hypothetical protein